MKNGMLKLISALTLIIAICNLAVSYLPKADSQNRIYVSPAGSNFSLQASKETPLKTIQKAVDSAKPGDRIIIMPGDYQERVHLWKSGTEARPITLEAEEPGTVTIHWKNESTLSKNQNWKDEGDDIYSISTSYPIYRASHNGEALFRMQFGSVESLKKLIRRKNAYSSLYYENNKCYLFLKNGLNPKDQIITTHQPVPEPREWGEFRSANLWVEGDHWIIKGLTLEYGIGSSVCIWNGENVRIENCVFSGAKYGVLTSKALKPAKHLIVDSCLYHNYPQYDWNVDWLNWNEIYAHYSSSCLSSTSHAPTTISNCLALHCGDGIQITSQKNSEDEIIVSQNIIANCTDDAIEFDGPSCHMMVDGNLILDSLVSLGLSPVSQGPVKVTNNLFLHPQPHQEGALFKLLSPRMARKTIQNVIVGDNIFWGNWLSWWNDATPVQNFTLENNQFFTKNQKMSRWPPNISEANNQYEKISSPELESDIDEEISRMFDQVNQSEEFKNLYLKLKKAGTSWWDWDNEPASKRLNHFLNQIEQQL